jgi:ribosomal protein S18 acetylase RimI-like enzyme
MVLATLFDSYGITFEQWHSVALSQNRIQAIPGGCQEILPSVALQAMLLSNGWRNLMGLQMTDRAAIDGGCVVRLAEATDCDAVAGLMGGQNDFHVELVPHMVKRVGPTGTKAWCASQLADPSFTIFLAETPDSEPLGLLMLHNKIYPDTAVTYGVNLAFIDELFVTAGYRRLGIGKSLIMAAKDYAVAAGCEGLSLNVWGANKLAIDAYDALGFEIVYQRMTWPLDKP